ncbi:MAG: hypothetical protein OXF22_05945 [Anaerolineaceae bacterium]|nr:hypothetical protein [Anaerolineaceae bacterium]
MENEPKWRVQWYKEIQDINDNFTEHRFTAIRELRMSCVSTIQSILFDDELNYEREISYLLESYTFALNILAHSYLDHNEMGPPHPQQP